MIRETNTNNESQLQDPQCPGIGCAMTWQAATGCLASQAQEIRHTYLNPAKPGTSTAASGCCNLD